MKLNIALICLMGASAIHLNTKKIEESKPYFTGFTPEYHGFEGNKGPFGEWRDAYERKVPEAFEGDQADSFTRKIIKDFAIEGQDVLDDDKLSHKPNGKFYMTPQKTREASYEVLKTHLGFDRKQADAHLDKYF